MCRCSGRRCGRTRARPCTRSRSGRTGGTVLDGDEPALSDVPTNDAGGCRSPCWSRTVSGSTSARRSAAGPVDDPRYANSAAGEHADGAARRAGRCLRGATLPEWRERFATLQGAWAPYLTSLEAARRRRRRQRLRRSGGAGERPEPCSSSPRQSSSTGSRRTCARSSGVRRARRGDPPRARLHVGRHRDPCRTPESSRDGHGRRDPSASASRSRVVGSACRTRVLRRSALELALDAAGLSRSVIVDGYLLVGTGGFEDHRYQGLSPRFFLLAPERLPLAAGLGARCDRCGAARAGGLLSPVRRGVHERRPQGVAVQRVGATGGRHRQHRLRLPVPVRPGWSRVGVRGVGATATCTATGRRPSISARSPFRSADDGHVRPGTVEEGNPMTLDDHQHSRMVVEPFRLLDRCRSTDGGVAVPSSPRPNASRPLPAATRSTCSASAPDTPSAVGTKERCSIDRRRRRGRRHRVRASRGSKSATSDVAVLYSAVLVRGHRGLPGVRLCVRWPGRSSPLAGPARRATIPTNTGGGHLSGFYANRASPSSAKASSKRGAPPRRTRSPTLRSCSSAAVAGTEASPGVLVARHARARRPSVSLAPKGRSRATYASYACD